MIKDQVGGMLMILEASQEKHMVTGKRGDQESTLKMNLSRGQEKIMIGSKIADHIEKILIDPNQKEEMILTEEKKRGPEGNGNFGVWVHHHRQEWVLEFNYNDI